MEEWSEDGRDGDEGDAGLAVLIHLVRPQTEPSGLPSETTCWAPCSRADSAVSSLSSCLEWGLKGGLGTPLSSSLGPEAVVNLVGVLLVPGRLMVSG